MEDTTNPEYNQEFSFKISKDELCGKVLKTEVGISQLGCGFAGFWSEQRSFAINTFSTGDVNSVQGAVGECARFVRPLLPNWNPWINLPSLNAARTSMSRPARASR